MTTRLETSAQHLEETLEEAVARGIVTEEQAEQIAALQAGAPQAPTEPAGGWLRPLVAEALGYVGGALALLAAAILVQQFWADLLPWGRVALLAGTAVGLLAAGVLVRDREGPLDRLRGFLWLLSTAALGGTVAVGLFEYTGLREAEMMLTVGSGVTAYGLGLWIMRTGSLQQLGVFAGVVIAVTAVIGVADPAWVDVTGLAVWVVGLAWALAAWTGWVRPRRTGLVVGSVAALFGPFTVPDDGFGWMLVVGLATAGLLVAVSIPARETVLLGLGVVGIFAYVPRIVFQYFGDTLGAPLSLLLTGVVLVGVALAVARSRPASRDTSDSGHGDTTSVRAA